MHILFLTDNFPPETNAPASRTHEHAKRWVADGHRVTVVTGVPNFPSGTVHPGYRNAIWQRETIDGIEVVRVWTYITANQGFLRRTLDYLSFMVSAILASPFLPRPDVIVATSPQFFTPCAALVVSVLRRRPFVFELRDLWPDSIVAVGAMRETMAIQGLRRLEYFLYRRAGRIVSVTHSFKKILVGNGINPDKIAVVPNGLDLDSYHPGEKSSALVTRLGVKGKFVAAYVGTLGMAHGLGAVLEAAALLRSRSNIVFVLVGTGAEQAALVQRCKDEHLGNVIFVGAVSKAEVREYWKLCDVALVLLRDSPLFEHVVPSKMFEAMGMKRPIILGVRGESREILEAAQAGIPITPESSGELAETIVMLAGDTALREELGKSGREFVAREFSRDHLADQMLSVLVAAAEGGR
ncbi:MAG: glycosyltransferase family 4 protein [Betaproteobacteria bacterium]|nr:glycosyltransferase family 4 protein [Betaproteobacteria bacterium]